MPTKKHLRNKPLANGRDRPKRPQVIVLYYEMINHKNFRSLNGSSVKILLELCTKHSGFNNRRIVCSYSQLAGSFNMSKSTVRDALLELQEKGFIVCTKKGFYTGRQASIWEITFLRSEGYDPPHLWKDLDQRPLTARPHLHIVNKDLIHEAQDDVMEIKNQQQVLLSNAKKFDGSFLEPMN